MRTVVALSLAALAAGTPAAFACDGKAEVEAAFIKQQKQPWRTEIVTRSETGETQEQVFDFQPPDKMYRKASANGESIETIGIGKWAWSNLGSGAGWEELQPMFARVVTIQVQEAFAPPRVTADFTCLGTVTVDGKSYLGYQTAPEKDQQGHELARTIYVDPATGLPAFNIVGPPGGNGEPLVKGAFTYPTDINIENPLR
jgi:hypothetical protein